MGGYRLNDWQEKLIRYNQDVQGAFWGPPMVLSFNFRCSGPGGAGLVYRLVFKTAWRYMSVWKGNPIFALQNIPWDLIGEVVFIVRSSEQCLYFLIYQRSPRFMTGIACEMNSTKWAPVLVRSFFIFAPSSETWTRSQFPGQAEESFSQGGFAYCVPFDKVCHLRVPWLWWDS